MAACPNCGLVLDAAPVRSKKCPGCRGQIVVRTDRGTKVRLLLTEKQAAEFDREQEAKAARSRAIRRTEGIGLTEADFLRAEEELSRQFGFRAVPGDTFWRLANEQVLSAMAAGDWHGLSMVYLSMGLHLHEEGRDARQVKHQANDAAVRHYLRGAREYGVGEGVRVLADACCEECRVLDGRVFSFEDALSLSPLPPDACTRDWCNCGWSLVID